ncbi:hypothetical protein FRX31_028672, partial [Thalictrum thalictroides]
MRRRELWTYLMNLGVSVSTPWLVLGELNSVLSAKEKVGGADLQHNYNDFLECVNIAGLVDMKYTWDQLTWNNGQNNRTWCKLDRTLINSEWTLSYPDHETEFLSPGLTSDHSTIVVTQKKQQGQNAKMFRFFNFWTFEEGYFETVARAWKST